jgi:hypothetical protein
MTGWKRVILGAKPQSVPNFFGFHRWTSAPRNDLDSAADYSRNRKSDQHRQEDARPFLIAAPPGDPSQYNSEREMFRPITEPAHVTHQIISHSVLMVRNEMSRGFIEVKSDSNDDCGNHYADEPVKNSSAVHK